MHGLARIVWASFLRGHLSRSQRGVRSYGLAVAGSLGGPWRNVTDRFATGDQLRHPLRSGGARWTDMVSHGEAIRSGYDETLEYEPRGCRWLIQGARIRGPRAIKPHSVLIHAENH